MVFKKITIKSYAREVVRVNVGAGGHAATEGTAEEDVSPAEAGERAPAGQEEPALPQPPEPQNGERGETDGTTH